MILKGAQRGAWSRLADHLLNLADNDHVEVHEISGFLADDLMGALQEVDAIAKGTRCKQFFFSVSFNPPEDQNVSIAAFEDAIARIEAKLGLTGQPRAVVFHEKNGRRHAHCVWSRINVAEMKAIKMAHFKNKVKDVARELYIEHGWDMPVGFEDHEKRDRLNYSNIEALQAKRAGKDPKALKQFFRQCWEASDSRSTFAQALKEHGLVLAQGDSRAFVAVDAEGKVYSISRWVSEKPKLIRKRLGVADGLPSIEEAQALLASHVSPSTSSHDHAALLAELEKRRQVLAEQQRVERDALDQMHAERYLNETKTRSSRLPKGMSGIWSRLAGNYAEIIKQNVLEALACKERDQKERQALIQEHLKQRRFLFEEIRHVRNRDPFDCHTSGIDPASLLLDVDPDQPFIVPLEEDQLAHKQRVNHDPADIISIIADKQEIFTRSDILRGLADYIDNPMELHGALEQALQCKDLVKLDGVGPKARYSSETFRACKRDLMASIHQMAESTSHSVDRAKIDKAIHCENAHLQHTYGANLSDEQVVAIRHALDGKQLSSIVGLAGAGKSTMLKAAKSAWEKQGYRVIGAALAGKAADGLQSSSGIESRTLASLEHSWASGYELLDNKSVLVIDEAGMVGTRQLARFVHAAARSGAKIVLVGDPEQLQPIQAGTPFKDIAATTKTAKLTEVRRQKSDWQRKATGLFAEGKNKEAIDAYRHHGCVLQSRDRVDAINRLTEDYLADRELNGEDTSRLALAHRRKDVHAINQSIRQMRKLSGDLSLEVLIETRHGPRSFAVSDRIVFTRNDRTLDVKNGMLGTIEAMNEGKLTVRLDEEDGESRTIEINPALYEAIDHGYAITIHKSQGATVDRAYVLGSTSMDSHLSYVALSRHRDEARLYADKVTLRKLEKDRDELEQDRSLSFSRSPSPSRY